ncbi:MAG: WhiB family transcriptional regulator [Acidimicrobiia bacterium]
MSVKDAQPTKKESAVMEAMEDTISLEILAAPIIDEKPWATFAACKDEVSMSFFPQNKAEERAALAVCGICPVQQDCLDHALATNERFGIWGGTTEKQRRTLRLAG